MAILPLSLDISSFLECQAVKPICLWLFIWWRGGRICPWEQWQNRTSPRLHPGEEVNKAITKEEYRKRNRKRAQTTLQPIKKTRKRAGKKMQSQKTISEQRQLLFISTGKKRKHHYWELKVLTRQQWKSGAARKARSSC